MFADNVLQNRKILVTGGGTGIGEKFCRALPRTWRGDCHLRTTGGGSSRDDRGLAAGRRPRVLPRLRRAEA